MNWNMGVLWGAMWGQVPPSSFAITRRQGYG